MYQIIVIGGGPAGVTAALRARELGAQVALVERGNLGGTCTNDGCVPTRVLAKAARLVRDTEQFADYGLTAEKPALDFSALLAATHQMVYRLHEKKQLISHLKEAGVDIFLRSGEASFVNAHSIALGNGDILESDKFIICVGGQARRLNFPGSEHTLTHSDIWSLNRLPASVAIIGGAATGCQLASIFNAFGTQVTLLEVGPNLLGREDPDITRTVENAFRKRGIQVITQLQGVDEVIKTESGLEVVYRHGDEVKRLPVEAAVQAVGWPGNVDKLNLGAVGIQTERGYISVNDYLQTSQANIFAAGDITGRMMLVQSASYEARYAAENAVLGIGQHNTHQVVPHGGFTDPEYGSVGLTEAQAKAAGLDYVAATVPYREMDRAVIDGHTEGLCKLLVDRDTHRILGAHVVGEQALEIVHLVASGMAADTWVEHLAELEIAYPTYTAIVGLAARQIVRELGVMPISPEWRVLGHPPAEWEISQT